MPLRSVRSLKPEAPPAWRDECVGTADGAAVGVRVYGCGPRADRAAAPRPLVLHLHAGAFVGGSLPDGAPVAQALVDAGAVVASVDYPLAPAHPFPQAVEAAYAALLWIDRQRRRLAVPRAPLFVAGEEAGGNLAAALALVARDRAGPELAGQILLSPMLDACQATASQRDARCGPASCLWATGWRAYLSRATDATHPYAMPGTAQRLSGLPATLLITAEDDPLRDETQAYARRLRAAGVSVELNVLAPPTGWPRSYWSRAEGDAAAPPWISRLRDHVRLFFAQPLSSPVQPTPVTSRSAP